VPAEERPGVAQLSDLPLPHRWRHPLLHPAPCGLRIQKEAAAAEVDRGGAAPDCRPSRGSEFLLSFNPILFRTMLSNAVVTLRRLVFEFKEAAPARV
jgi:hypothetical protein